MGDTVILLANVLVLIKVLKKKPKCHKQLTLVEDWNYMQENNHFSETVLQLQLGTNYYTLQTFLEIILSKYFWK